MENNTFFKVIRILDEYRIVINAGADTEITDQCYFQIIGANNEIIDPETKKSMGMIHSVKELVRPVLIEDQFCVCEHFDDRFAEKSEIVQEHNMLFTNSRKLNINKEQILTYAIDEPINVLDKAILIVMKSAEERTDHSPRTLNKKHFHSLSLFSPFLG